VGEAVREDLGPRPVPRSPAAPESDVAAVADMQHCRPNVTTSVSILHTVSEPRHRVEEGEAMTPTSTMNEYVFEVRLRAVVRVRASDEGVARNVVSSVLGAPGSVEINLANENNARLGRRATVTEVDFVHEKGPRLLKDDVARP
jgi:hypothetical protein